MITAKLPNPPATHPHGRFLSEGSSADVPRCLIIDPQVTAVPDFARLRCELECE